MDKMLQLLQIIKGKINSLESCIRAREQPICLSLTCVHTHMFHAFTYNLIRLYI